MARGDKSRYLCCSRHGRFLAESSWAPCPQCEANPPPPADDAVALVRDLAARTLAVIPETARLLFTLAMIAHLSAEDREMILRLLPSTPNKETTPL